MPEEETRATTTTTVDARWRGGRRFDVGVPNGPTTVIDGDGGAGTGPVNTLLGALAACASIDILGYFDKRRTPAEALDVHIVAVRRKAAPRRILSALLEIHIVGAEIDAEHAARAIDLSFQNYCSVTATLAPDVVLETQLVLNGAAYPAVQQHGADSGTR